MTSQPKQGACAFAWRNYLLVHSDVSENDDRRAALSGYVTNLPGEYDFDLLQIAAIALLFELFAEKAGSSAFTRTINRATALRRSNCSSSSWSDIGKESDGTGKTYSPSMPRNSRLVASIRANGHR